MEKHFESVCRVSENLAELSVALIAALQEKQRQESIIIHHKYSDRGYINSRPDEYENAKCSKELTEIILKLRLKINRIRRGKDYTSHTYENFISSLEKRQKRQDEIAYKACRMRPSRQIYDDVVKNSSLLDMLKSSGGRHYG